MFGVQSGQDFNFYTFINFILVFAGISLPGTKRHLMAVFCQMQRQVMNMTFYAAKHCGHAFLSDHGYFHNFGYYRIV